VRAVSGLALAVALAPAGAVVRDLADLSLEELANVEITSVSRRAERLSDAAASVYLITAEAIRRAGATSLPEALRLAPNLQVARVNAGEYAITARGFNNAIGNKLLVLIDGRTVYTPFFSGVFWDQQDVMLEDIERIEVISGPGATLWGANAVNGVINVITRSAHDTQGTLATAAAGSAESQLAVRYGGRLGDNAQFRIQARRSHVQNTETAAGTAVPDRADRQQIGFRADWADGPTQLTVQGDASKSESEPRPFGSTLLDPVSGSGSNLLARWTQQLADGSTLRVQAYEDASKRDDALLYRPEVHITDLDVQHAFVAGAHQWVWGGGYRRARDEVLPGLFFGFDPQSRSQHWTNLFAQDDIRLGPALQLTLGAKLERNDYTGTEKLPSARLAWKLDDDQLLWASLSRAVRAPARLDRDIRLPPTPPYIIAGGPDFVSEVANVAEIGWRAQPNAELTYSATLFSHRWDRLRSGQPPPDAMVQNMIEGETYGLEAWASWRAARAWTLSSGLTLLREDLRLKPGSTDPTGPSSLGNDPQTQWSLRSMFDLDAQFEFDATARHVSALPNPAVPGYTAVDLRVGWQPRPDVALSVVGQDVFDAGHAEFGESPGRSEFARALLVQLRLSF
jgi:iron complex outermembrane receptor protein